MHGIIRPDEFLEKERKGFLTNLYAALSDYKFFLLIVIFPTLLVAGYYYLIASDQYESSANFVVQRADASPAGGAGVGQLLGFDFGTSPTASEAYLVEEYLMSHDVVARLSKEDDLVNRFRRPGTD